MSRYTTEVRFICENAYPYEESKGYNDIDDIVDKVHTKIFNFNYPIFDVNYKKTLETKILKHFYTREIGEETVGLWKLRLNAKMNEIMPYYNKLYESELLEFNPLYTHNLTREHKGDSHDITHNSNSNTTNYGKVIVDDGTNGNTNYNLYSDTPQGGLDGIEAIESQMYLTNATKYTDSGSNHNTNTSSGSDSNSGESDGRLDNDNHYLETVVGYEGRNASEMIMKYRQTFLNIDMQVIDELEVLFMQLW